MIPHSLSFVSMRLELLHLPVFLAIFPLSTCNCAVRENIPALTSPVSVLELTVIFSSNLVLLVAVSVHGAVKVVSTMEVAGRILLPLGLTVSTACVHLVVSCLPCHESFGVVPFLNAESVFLICLPFAYLLLIRFVPVVDTQTTTLVTHLLAELPARISVVLKTQSALASVVELTDLLVAVCEGLGTKTMRSVLVVDLTFLG